MGKVADDSKSISEEQQKKELYDTMKKINLEIIKNFDVKIID